MCEGLFVLALLFINESDVVQCSSASSIIIQIVEDQKALFEIVERLDPVATENIGCPLDVVSQSPGLGIGLFLGKFDQLLCAIESAVRVGKQKSIPDIFLVGLDAKGIRPVLIFPYRKQ
ncbi:MAG: Uncharacterised protein [Flavobacteriia bacterium]|nr:MAG: Uncharacterised protein [Flavobacteriia bacterium]